MTNQTPNQPRSVYSWGAEAGITVGVAMTATFLLMVMSSKVAWLSLVTPLLLLYIPYMVWLLLRKRWINGDISTQFSAAWLYGICTFLFGAIILALGIYIILSRMFPDWVITQMSLTASLLAEKPDTVELSRQITELILTGRLPSAISIAMSMMWFVGFTGSLWSMLFAAIITNSRKMRILREEQCNNRQHTL